MKTEIERKYLVNKEKWESIEKGEGLKCRQSYLHTDPNKTIRVRTLGNKGYITFKGKLQNLTKPEYEYEVPLNDAIEMIELFGENLIVKTRFLIEVSGKMWEVDVFEADNQGLIMAEIELESENEDFEMPEWVINEVSSDKRFQNSYLSENPYTNW